MAQARPAGPASVDRALVVVARRPEVAEFLAINLRGHGLAVHRIAREAGADFSDGTGREVVVVGFVENAGDADFFEEAVRVAHSSYALGLIDRKAPEAVVARADAVAASLLRLPVASETLAESVRSLLSADNPPVRARARLGPSHGAFPRGTEGEAVVATRKDEAEVVAEPSARIPDELRTFLSAPHPRTLLVKGRPGTGKTTLALALLEFAEQPGYYLSNRVSLTSLLDYHPRLRYRLPPDHVLDAGDFRRIVTGSVHWGEAVDLLLLDRDPLEREPERDGPPLPPPVRELLARIRAERPGPPPVVVVDSWEALGRAFVTTGREARARLGAPGASADEAFLHLVQDAGSHLVFVLESEAETPLDYLADGIVALERESRHDRLFRRLRFDKLRGTSTQRMIRPFTLEGGIFRSLEPPPAGPGSLGRPFRWSPLLGDPASVSWGNETADRFLGPMRPGGSYLWENAPSVPVRALQGLASLPVFQNLVAGWRVVLLPSMTGAPTAYPESLTALLHPDVARAARENLFVLPGDARRLLGALSRPPDEDARMEVHAEVPELKSSGIVPTMLQALLAASQPRTLFAANVLGLHAASGLDNGALGTFLSRWVTRVHESGAVLMLGVPTGHPTLSALEYRMLGHYRWWSTHGTLFVAGEKPFTPFFAVEPDTEAGGFPLCRLVPVS